MASKKTSKSAPKKEEAAVAASPVVRPVIIDNPIMPVERYLMSIGTRADHITPRAIWAKGQGLTIATVSQWKKLFESF